jgi:hypothetical protein
MACAILTTSWLALGCGGESAPSSTGAEVGTVALPLSAVAPSGVEYRLRNATFNIWGWTDTCTEQSCEYDETISSEDYLDQPTIMLDLLRGSYYIYLNEGWELEKILDGVGEVVEAQLLNSNYQYVWIQPYQTMWVTYQFGVGDEVLWFTGQLQIQMEVYEDPDDYYGPDCYYYGDGVTCWEECCREYCDPYGGCWGECWGQEIPCDEMPEDAVRSLGGVPVE